MIIKNNKEITECPNCGTTFGYYVNVTMSGKGIYYFKFDGSTGDNTELHEPINYKLSKTAYCSECNFKLGKVKDTL